MQLIRDEHGQLYIKPPPSVNELFLNSLNQNRRLKWERPPKKFPHPDHIGLTAPFDKSLWGFPSRNDRDPLV